MKVEKDLNSVKPSKVEGNAKNAFTLIQICSKLYV